MRCLLAALIVSVGLAGGLVSAQNGSDSVEVVTAANNSAFHDAAHEGERSRVIGSVEAWIALIGAVIGGFISLAATIYSSRRNLETSSAALRIQSAALQLRRVDVQQAYRSRVIDWANEVVAIFSECTTLCELDPQRASDFFSERNRLRSRLSELIDRGRWFFENDRNFPHGQEKRRVNREKLNYREMSNNSAHREPIVQFKKDFVDEIQRFVQPSATLSEFGEIQEKLEEIHKEKLTTEPLGNRHSRGQSH